MTDILIAVIFVMVIIALVLLNNRVADLEYKMNQTYMLLKLMNK